MKAWAAVLLLVSSLAGAAPQAVLLPSLDQRGGVAIELPGFWFPASVSTPAPAVLLLHGCGGPYAQRGQLSRRMLDYAALLNGEGLHVLITDSLTPRGETELCTQRVGTRSITQTQRRRDALAALQWLARQPGVDAHRLGLLGWSNGGSTVLAALQREHAEVAASPVKPAFAVAFYPGCEDVLKQRWSPTAPLLLLLGAADDWTPAAPCVTLAMKVNALPDAPRLQHETYAGAYHGFDGTAAVRHRRDVPNGVNPGQGVHVGGNAIAREASRERLLGFLRQAARPQSP